MWSFVWGGVWDRNMRAYGAAKVRQANVDYVRRRRAAGKRAAMMVRILSSSTKATDTPNGSPRATMPFGGFLRGGAAGSPRLQARALEKTEDFFRTEPGRSGL